MRLPSLSLIYIHSYQERNVFEKIGEPTEVALKVLGEKLNITNQDRTVMSGQQKASACLKATQNEYNKLFTLEFSRDRKSMSVYCRRKKDDSAKPLMFVKVRRREIDREIDREKCEILCKLILNLFAMLGVPCFLFCLLQIK